MKAITLLILAIVLFVVIAPFGIVYTLIMSLFWLENPFKYIEKIIIRIAVAIDQLGNTVCGDLLNAIFLKSGSYFGHEDDTVSKVLSEQKYNLSIVGEGLYNLLEKIDPGHGKRAELE